MSDRPRYVYVTYIESSPGRVWEALTDPHLTAQYWGHSNVSSWQAGAPWEHRRLPGGRPCAPNLKSLLETAHVLPRAPWEMHAELRAAQMARNDLRPSGS